VDFRFGRGRRAFEEIEVATLVRLGDVLLIQRPEAAFVLRRGSLPPGAAPRQFVIADLQFQPARGHVEFDEVAVAHEGERTANE